MRIESIIKKVATAEKLHIDPIFQRLKCFIDPTNAFATKFDFLRDAVSPNTPKLLDFGCGRMAHRSRIEGMGYFWTGVDLEVPSDFRGEIKKSDEYWTYDGRDLPFADQSYDLVFSSQSFEHVEDPFYSMSEITRVLKPGGKLVGSVSFLEPYHAYQTFSYTPYGFALLADRCGLSLKQISPVCDGLQMLFRKLELITGSSDVQEAAAYPSLSFLLGEKYSKLSDQHKAGLILQFCGQFNFHFERAVT